MMAGGDVNSINYGFNPPAAPTYTLSGKVYSDNDPDGLLNGGDTGLSGVTVTITCGVTPGTPYSNSVVTAADGSYSISGVPDGVTCNSFSSDTASVHPGYTAHQTPTNFTIAGADVNSINYGYIRRAHPSNPVTGQLRI